MPGSTVKRQYPYPVGTDPINVATDIKNLADAIDFDTGALAGAGWASLEVRPTGNADTGVPGGTPTIWISGVAPKAPAFATSVLVIMSVTGHFCSGAAGNIYRLNMLRTDLGPPGGGVIEFHDAGSGFRISTCTSVAAFPVTPGVAHQYEVWTSAVIASAGVLRADASSVFAFSFLYRNDPLAPVTGSAIEIQDGQGNVRSDWQPQVIQP